MQLKSNHYRALNDEVRKNYFLSSSFIQRLFTQYAYTESTFYMMGTVPDLGGRVLYKKATALAFMW